jgi:hypothetical protein
VSDRLLCWFRRLWIRWEIRGDIYEASSAARVARPLTAVLQQVQSLRYRSRTIGRVSGLRSKALMARLVAWEVFWGKRNQPAADAAMPVCAKGLDDRAAWLCPRSYDRAALEFLYRGSSSAASGAGRTGRAHRGIPREHRLAAR